MEALRQLWRVLGIIFQGIYSLWQKYWTYRAQKAQQRQLDAAQEQLQTPVVPAVLKPDETSSNLDQSTDVKQQIELSLSDVAKHDIPSEAAELGQWYPPGHGVHIQGMFIADGFLYVGRRWAAQSSEDLDVSCLINPDLTIQFVSGDQRQGVIEMDWAQNGRLGYDTLSPEMRGIFLGWLGTGRKEREIPLGALLLFLYGVEYRVVELLRSERTLDELLAIILELERLEVHYAHHHTATPKIQGLIECCQVQLALSCQPETLLALLPMGQTLSMALKVALGRCIEANRSIPMSLLWAWYQSSTVAVDLKTPAKRCEREFNFLIQTRGDRQVFSIAIGDHPATFPVVYRPFSPAFDQDSTLPILDTIEITELEPQLACLEPLIETCTHDLDAYSRFIGRVPDAEGSLLAVALLPQELFLLSGDDSVQAFQTWLNETVGSADWITLVGSDLLVHWPTATPGKIKKKEADLLGQLMAKLGFGYVPDVRYGQGTFNPKHSVVLFRLNVPGLEAISTQYPLASVMSEILDFLELDAQNEAVIEVQEIASHFDLSSSERSRLIALEQWRLERPLTWKKFLGQIKKLSGDQQSQLAIVLQTTFSNQWQLSPSRYLELQALIPLPKLDSVEPRSSVNTDVDLLDEDLASRTQSQSIETETAIASTPSLEEQLSPVEPEDESDNEPESPTFVLDTQLIAQRHQESQIASGLLSDIFTETEEESLPSLPTSDDTPPPMLSSDATLSLGLDEFHWHLLHHLGQKNSWQRSELEAIAQNQGLLLDGALENINDVAFDQCDEALTEGEDPIEVNDWVYDELKAA